MFHMSEVWSNNYWQLSLYKIQVQWVFILCEVEWGYVVTFINHEDSNVWSTFAFCIISKE
jgi:hypothetical protein